MLIKIPVQVEDMINASRFSSRSYSIGPIPPSLLFNDSLVKVKNKTLLSILSENKKKKPTKDFATGNSPQGSSILEDD